MNNSEVKLYPNTEKRDAASLSFEWVFSQEDSIQNNIVNQ